MKKKAYLFLVFLLCLLSSCQQQKEDKRFLLRNNTGIAFQNTIQTTPELNILNYLYFYNGAGVALADFNNDGLLDAYFTANQTQDKLYINQGNLTFKNSTEQSHIPKETGWTTGVTTVDINADGLMDLYISKVSGHLHLTGENILLVNQGLTNGIPTFKNEAEKYQLNYSGLSTQASFFDYDLDGDLDVYLLNHSLYPNKKYRKGRFRNKIDSLIGDRLLENRDGLFFDVSKEAGILQNNLSFGLGLATSDINNDGYPDIYVGNDFFEDDYLYINQKDGTFSEINTTKGALGHSTHFSMGNELVDINNDGRVDIFSVDMLPEDIATLKSAGAEYNYPIFQNQLKQGYQPQFMQNTLHLNLGNEEFTETAFLHEVAATEWSWSPLVSDFDNDGYKDLYITNGILGATNDMDFVNFIANDKIQKRLGEGMQKEDLEFVAQLPKKKTSNYFFRNNDKAPFSNVTESWFDATASFSNGAAYGDLDNDGDLDIIVNNVNETAFLLENNTQKAVGTSNFLQLFFKGSQQNSFGIGAKIHVFTDEKEQHFENQTTRGYLSAVSPSIFVGLGKTNTIDSLKVIWPGGAYETLTQIATNTAITLNQRDASGDYYSETKKHISPILTVTETPIGFKHEDGVSLEFSRDPLIPIANTNLGPKIVTGDLNNDDLEDFVALGGKGQPTQLWMQQSNGSFLKKELPNSSETSIHEDIDAVLFDTNADGTNELLIVSGGGEFKTGKPLRPKLYAQKDGTWYLEETNLSTIEVNASSISLVDIDQDSDLDICITSNIVPQYYGKTPKQYLFINNGDGDFSLDNSTFSESFATTGNVYDIQWVDLDNNGFKDAIVAGYWMPITIYLNDGETLQKQQKNHLEKSHGWWNTLEVADFDKDGDLDIIAGNFGKNTRLKPTAIEPVTLYSNDFDENGNIEPILTYFHQHQETTLATKDELAKQIPLINKKFLSYSEFAKADIETLLSREKIKGSETKKAFEFASCYFENKGDMVFEKRELPFMSQVSSVNDILIEDLNDDSFLDVFLVGNTYEISTQLGRLDGSQGTLLLNDKNGFFTQVEDQNFSVKGACRSIEKMTILNKDYYVVGRNNDTPLFLKKEE